MRAVRNSCSKQGAVELILIVMLLASVMILSFFNLGHHSGREAMYEKKSMQAFWIAEAGVHRCIANLYAQKDGEIYNAAVGDGTFTVRAVDTDKTIYESVGTVMMAGEPVSRRVQIELQYIAEPFEDAVYSANGEGRSSTGAPWNFMMNGSKVAYDGSRVEGPPPPYSRGDFWGGNDVVIGNVNVNGGVRMYDESAVKLLPADDNPYDILSDIECHNGLFHADTGVSYPRTPLVSNPTDYNPPDLGAMDYASNNDWDVAAEFIKYKDELVDAGNDGGDRLPVSHPLYDVVVKRNSSTTTGDDYFFEPRSMGTSGETPADGKSLITLGDDVTYYVDGHVWFRSTKTYGFVIDGQSTIVSSKDIHIGDNIIYKDRGRSADSDMLALVALGQLDVNGNYDGDGNIFFGDPNTGTLYACDAFMFANNNFLYNTSIDGDSSKEQPESGFKVFGNFMAMNQVVVKRDWYWDGISMSGTKKVLRPAEFVPITDDLGVLDWVWVDSVLWDAGSTSELTIAQISSIQHYAMEVEYDDRIRDVATQMSGLPHGRGSFIAGYTWKELPML